MLRKSLFLTTLAFILLGAACTKSKPKFTVGGQTSTDQIIIAEILAQQIESKLGLTVIRRTGFTSPEIMHQALLMNEVDLYAETVGAIAANVLKETPDRDPLIVLERVKSELDRSARIQVLGSLGFDNPFVVVVRTADAREKKLATISDAAESKGPWEMAASGDFLGRLDGITALQGGHRLVSATVPRSMPYQERYRMLREKHINMVIGTATDGELADEAQLTVLKDDKNSFFPSQTIAATRADVLQAYPQLRSMVSDIAAKLSTATMRKLDGEVENRHRDAKAVVEDFLAGRIK